MASTSASPVVAFDGVWFVRDRRPILHGVDWQVSPGERWVVLGPNGAGKSTVLHLASTYELPTRGRVHVLGSRVGGVDLRTVRPHIGYVSAALSRLVVSGSTALETVVTGLDASLRRWRQEFTPEDWRRARELLELFGCGHVHANRFSTLSEGERQRVLIARSLMPRPQLLLLDEPAASLDLGGREQLIAALSRLAADDLPAIVLVTHHVEEIPPGFTHALLLREGGIVRAGPIDTAMTSASLSACFGLPIALRRWEQRYVAATHLPERSHSQQSTTPETSAR